MRSLIQSEVTWGTSAVVTAGRIATPVGRAVTVVATRLARTGPAPGGYARPIVDTL